MTKEEKETIESLIASIKTELQDVLAQAKRILPTDTDRAGFHFTVGMRELPPMPPEIPASFLFNAIPVVPASSMAPHSATLIPLRDAATPSAISEVDWAESVRRNATVSVERLRLRDGATGWPLEKAFPSKYLNGAVSVRLVDPYLSKPHQIRNLNEFLLHLTESARPKSIEVVTGLTAAEFSARQDRAFCEAAKDLFKNYGVTASLRRETGLHDRYVIMDHGVLFKLGRGLDIFKPASGLAEYRPACRRTRETDVDIFCAPDHALASVSALSDNAAETRD